MRAFHKLACVSSIAIWLSACAQTCPPPKVVTQVVKEPVAVACIDPASVGTEPGKIQLSADARIAADQAAGQASRLRAYIHELLALIQPCTRNPA